MQLADRRREVANMAGVILPETLHRLAELRAAQLRDRDGVRGEGVGLEPQQVGQLGERGGAVRRARLGHGSWSPEDRECAAVAQRSEENAKHPGPFRREV
jgi:hypothetical protein